MIIWFKLNLNPGGRTSYWFRLSMFTTAVRGSSCSLLEESPNEARWLKVSAVKVPQVEHGRSFTVNKHFKLSNWRKSFSRMIELVEEQRKHGVEARSRVSSCQSNHQHKQQKPRPFVFSPSAVVRDGGSPNGGLGRYKLDKEINRMREEDGWGGEAGEAEGKGLMKK